MGGPTVRRIILAILLIAVLAGGTCAYAEWRVDFESKTVKPNQDSVTVAITASWDLPLAGADGPELVLTSQDLVDHGVVSTTLELEASYPTPLVRDTEISQTYSCPREPQYPGLLSSSN